MPRTDVAASPSLANALESLRARGLGLRRGSEPEPLETSRPAIPSGHAALDVALGTDGWPRGALALLDAPAGGGATTLAMSAVAAAPAGGGLGGRRHLPGALR